MDKSQQLLEKFVNRKIYYSSNHHRQQALTKSIVGDLVVGGNLPLNIVEQQWFSDFMNVVDIKYKLPKRRNVGTLVGRMFTAKQNELRDKLGQTHWISLTLDMWSDRRMRSYMGITAHFLDKKMELNSCLLDLTQFTGSHTADNISDKCIAVLTEFEVKDKVYFVVSDNAANMQKAFKDNTALFGDTAMEIGLSGDESELQNEAEGIGDDGEVGDEDMDDDAEAQEIEDIDDDIMDMTELDDQMANSLVEIMNAINKKRLPCAIHTLQLVVLDGLKTAKFLTNIQSKASRLATIIHTSGTFQERYFGVFRKTVPRTTNTRWNSFYLQMEAIAKLDTVQLQKMLVETKNDNCVFTSREMNTLRELVSILEPAYTATLIWEEEDALISVVAPSVSKLFHMWSSLADSTSFCHGLARSLLEGLDKRFGVLLRNIGHLPRADDRQQTDRFGDTAYLVSSALDPEFGLDWLNEDTRPFVTGNAVLAKNLK